MIYEVTGTEEIKNIFATWMETMVWSCIQGVMGHLYADSPDNPQSAMAVLGDFCFFAGTPNTELVLYKPKYCRQEFMIMTALSPDWFPLIEAAYREKAKRVSRFAIKKELNVFDKGKLNSFVANMKEGVTLCMIDKATFGYCRKQEWSRDFVSQYTDYEEYRRLGLGVLAIKNGVPVSGASSYSSYQGGIEIEIDTKEEYRRQGLATACGAKLILECLERGLYPSWDAQNRWSVSLAEKLGYHFDYEYTAYEITGY